MKQMKRINLFDRKDSPPFVPNTKPKAAVVKKPVKAMNKTIVKSPIRK